MIADKGSLRAAARTLGMSQPALTHNISELERELGATLFERRARGMTPTPVGQLFLRRANIISTEARRAQDEVEQYLGGHRGEVVVCLSIVAHFTLLPMALPMFQNRYPEVRLRIVEASFPAVEGKLRDGTMDFYIGPLPDLAPAREFSTEQLFENTRAVFARRGHPLTNAKSLAALTNASWVSTGITDKAETELAQLFARHKLPAPRLVVQAESMLTLLTTLMSSDALAITLRQYDEFPLTRSVLQIIDIKEALPAPPIVLMKRSGFPLTPSADYLCDMFRRASTDYQATSRRNTSPCGSVQRPG